MDLNEVWAEMDAIGAKIELNEGGHPILNVPDGKAMSEASFNTIIRRLPDLRSFLKFKEWNGTTKNDWFFMLWWAVVIVWTIHCGLRIWQSLKGWSD